MLVNTERKFNPGERVRSIYDGFEAVVGVISPTWYTVVDSSQHPPKRVVVYLVEFGLGERIFLPEDSLRPAITPAVESGAPFLGVFIDHIYYDHLKGPFTG